MAKTDKRLYTAIKEFKFRGLEFKPGDPFDPVAVYCDSSRLRALLNGRFVAEGYDGEKDALSLAKGGKPTMPPKHTEQPAEPHSTPTEGKDNNGEEAPAPHRRRRR